MLFFTSYPAEWTSKGYSNWTERLRICPLDRRILQALTLPSLRLCLPISTRVAVLISIMCF